MTNWPGHDPEGYRQLEQACLRNCDCASDSTPGRKCGAHQLLDDTRLHNRLACIKETLEHFRVLEFCELQPSDV